MNDKKKEFISRTVTQIISSVTDLVMPYVENPTEDFDLQVNKTMEKDGNYFRAYYGIEKISEEQHERVKNGVR